MNIEIKEVNGSKELKKFIDFPHYLYKDDPRYVPALYLSEKWMLSKKNPFFRHSECKLYLATKKGKIVGRIAAILNTRHQEIYQDQRGFFGFFDSIDDNEVAESLLNTAENWLRSKDCRIITGPCNLTTNDSCGILCEGYSASPVVLMPYNYRYYNELCTVSGYRKELDLFAYDLDATAVEKRYSNLLERGLIKMKEHGIRIRPASRKNFGEDMLKLRPVYNSCNKNNWGFMPLDEVEFMEMAKDLKRVTPLDLALLVEKGDKIIGFVIGVPDINQALKHMRKGRLFPFGFIKLLWFKRKIDNARVLILGMLDEYKGSGIDLALYQKLRIAVNSHNIFHAEACYVMETNTVMNSILQKIEGKKVKAWRMYSKDIQ